MLKNKVMALAFSLLALVGAVNAQEKYSKVIIYPSSKEQRLHVIGLLELDHFMESGSGIVSEISASDIAQLKASRVKYRVLVDDVVENLRAENLRFLAARKKGIDLSAGRVALEQSGNTLASIIKTPAAFEVKSTFGGYYSFAEMEAAMNTLVKNYPSIARKDSIGRTYENRALWVIKISDNVATDEANEPEVLYMGLQHAREAITGSSMIFLMQYLCENYATDQKVRDLVNNREFFIIPCFNPDGWEYNRTSMNNQGGGMWRKNRSPNGGPGVDLNRNWGVDWGNCSAPILGAAGSCGSSTKTSDTYYGPNAFSEMETQAVRDFAKSHHIVAGFDQHAYGPYYSLPFGRQSLNHVMPQKGKDFYTAIPALMGTYNGMRAADSYDALGYEVAGGFKDWMLMGEIGVGTKDTVWAMTGEGGAGNASNDFWAPMSQIEYLSKGMCYQNLQLALAAGTYVDIQDANDIALTSTSGNLNFSIKRLGLGNDPVTVSVTALENIKITGAPVTVASMGYYEQYNGSIAYQLNSGLTDGQRVRYIWKVSAAGYSYSDTVEKLYNPLVLFSDNMESADITTNWTVSGTWSYSTDGAYGGTKSLTESPGGLYSSSANDIITFKNTLDLSDATAAYLTFWTRHRAENFRDKLQLQVGTLVRKNTYAWTTIAGSTTVQEPGNLDGSTLSGEPALTGIRDYWTQEVYDISAYKNAGVKFRFVFTSDGDGTSFKYQRDDGFYIDNLKVVKSTATLVALPVTFISFTGKLLQDKTVQLNWEAVADAEHDHFEIERSVDGRTFMNLGRSGTQPPYRFIDPLPNVGNNFYRIKQLDKDGKVSYSKTINIPVGAAVETMLYPNPASDVLNIMLRAEHPEKVTIKITDLQGRVVYRQNASTLTGTDLKVDISTWKPQFYIVTLYNSKEEVIATEKIIKH